MQEQRQAIKINEIAARHYKVWKINNRRKCNTLGLPNFVEAASTMRLHRR